MLPVSVIDLKSNAAEPLLVTVTVLAAEVVPAFCVEKESDVGLNCTAGPPLDVARFPSTSPFAASRRRCRKC
jgi:hypothetical protein